ncbi:MAG: M48 family metallopeptidase [Chromatiales bacterium]|nr:M48 family metallopeptidase [Chromatiales bacterium]
MDFFTEQQAARRSSRRLVMLFLLAVVVIIVTLYLVLVGVIAYSANGRHETQIELWQPELFAIVAAAISSVILLSSLYKVMQLSSGGGAGVAESLGGRLVSRSTNDQLERRLLNVVDEMAIASGIPVPQVYILDDEHGINAFAAGTNTSNAVVAVTRGTLEQLSRDELQGVVGHEFSHIFNGDMRLNIRLMGVLHGILVLALIGRVILRGGARGHRGSYRSSSSSNNKGGGGIVVLAIALFIIGYIGVFFGRLIKAAVSRQREFLADASAVQFTRNPDGIAGALKKIAGFDSTKIEHPDAESASHMFFGSGISSYMQMLATHPPVEERIARLDPYFSQEWQQRLQPQTGGGELPGSATGFAAFAAGGGSTARVVSQSVGNHDERHLDYAHTLLERLPEGIWSALRDPNGARALIFAMVVSRDGMKREQLIRALPQVDETTLVQTLALAALLREVPRGEWLPLLELAIPSVEELPLELLGSLPDQLDALINADKRVTLFEFSLATLLRHTLRERESGKGEKPRGGMRQVKEDMAQLLALMAHAGHQDEAMAREAFNLACGKLEAGNEMGFIPRNQLSLKEIETSLQRLAHLNVKFKGRVIEAATTAVMADGEVKLHELDLLRAIGACLDCPIPPLQVGVVGAV